MTLTEDREAMVGPRVRGDLPGPRSAELLARQERRESNARVYGRHLPIAVEAAAGSFVRDVDGNVFIDFLTGAGVLSLGHCHPELVEVAVQQIRRFGHGLDLPTPAKDAFTEAQLSMLPVGMRAARGRIPIVASAVTLLPHPDSPTRPSVSPGRTSKVIPLTAYTSPLLVQKRTRRSSTERRAVSLMSVRATSGRASRARRRRSG